MESIKLGQKLIDLSLEPIIWNDCTDVWNFLFLKIFSQKLIFLYVFFELIVYNVLSLHFLIIFIVYCGIMYI